MIIEKGIPFLHILIAFCSLKNFIFSYKFLTSWLVDGFTQIRNNVWLRASIFYLYCGVPVAQKLIRYFLIWGLYITDLFSSILHSLVVIEVSKAYWDEKVSRRENYVKKEILDCKKVVLFLIIFRINSKNKGEKHC